MDKFVRSVVCSLWSVVFLIGCGQPPKVQNTAQNEVVVASTPITASTAPAEPLPKPTELASSQRSWIGASIERIARNKTIQMALKNANFYSGEIDGKIGPRTKEAVKKFQTSKNLTADGIIGAKTWTELKSYLPQEQNE